MGAGLVLLAAAQETLPLHQDDTVAADFLGKIGLEKKYESEMRGKRGVRTVEVDVFGMNSGACGSGIPINPNTLIGPLGLGYKILLLGQSILILLVVAWLLRKVRL